MKKRVNGAWVTTSPLKYGTSTDTLTTLPADIYANDTTATVGLKGNMSQSSIPSASSPVMPQECGERTGNLLDESSILNGYYTAASGFPYTADDKYRCFNLALAAGTYTLKATMTGNTIYLLRVSSATLGGNAIYVNTQYTFTLTEADTIYVSFRNVDTTTDFTGLKVMLNTGSTALPYEPYGYKIPISSNSTTTNVYLGEVETTRKIEKYVLTGQENITFYDASSSRVGFYFNRSNAISNGRATGICSHFKAQSSPSGSQIDGVTFGTNNKNFYFTFSAQSASAYNLTDVTSIEAWLAQQYTAGTPVTVWYVLATETTGIVNEPLRKIGDYADTVSGITIPTIAGKDSFDVLTTLKPSEVELTYTGWHDATVKEWDGSQWD